MALNASLPSMSRQFVEALEFIEDMTQNTDRVQERVLAEILSQNANTEYLQRFNPGSATDRDIFKSKVPVIIYEDLQPYIKRIANGDRSPILSSHPISEFLTSSSFRRELGITSKTKIGRTLSETNSGTSGGERKLMPSISEEMERRQKLNSLLMPVINLYVPGLDKGKGFYFLFVRAETKTPGGIVARPVLTSYYKSHQFKTRPYDPFNVYTSPNEAILCCDTFQSMYTQMMCGLIMRDEVLRVGAVFATGFLRAIKFLQTNWRQLAHDIASGSLNPKITDPPIQQRMATILKPNPNLAEFIIKECESENWERIIPRIWPNTKYVDVIITGAMAQYVPILDFYSGGLPLLSTMYASSECSFGLNLKPMTKPSEVSYTIMPNMGYFEFIPHDPTDLIQFSRDSTPELVDLADVVVGKEYELVVTTYSGLCRYRVGDILRVTGFHNSAPQFKFIRRKNVLLSIEDDKTNELELQTAIENASALLQEFDASVVEYTSYADAKIIPGHYVIYWELLIKDPSNTPGHDVLEKCCLVMEESMNSVYKQCRASDKSIGPLEIRVVKNGTFEELMEYAISRGASINQYKTPRCVTYPPIVDLLNAHVLSSHFSPAPPQWTPKRLVENVLH